MNYPLIEVFLCLLPAAIVGAIAGWMVHRLISNKSWENKLMDLQEEHEETENLLTNFKKQNKSLNSQLLHLTSEVKTKENSNITLAKSFTKVRTARIEAEDQLRNVTGEFEKSQEDNKDLSSQYTSLNEEMSVLNSHHNSVKAVEAELKSALTTAKDENTQLKSRLMDSSIQAEELEQIKSDLAFSLDKQIDLTKDHQLQLEKTNKELSKVEEALSTNEKATSQSLKAAKSKQDEFKENLKTANKEQVKLKEELVLTKKIADNYDVEKTRNTKLKAKNVALVSEVSTLQKQASNVSSQLKDNEVKLIAFNSLNDQYNSLLEKQNKNKALEENSKKVDQFTQDNDTLKAKYQDEMKLLAQDNEVLKTSHTNEINQLSQNNEALIMKHDDKVKQLVQDNETLKSQYETIIKDKEAIKEQLTSSLGANKKLIDNEAKYKQSQKETKPLQSVQEIGPITTAKSEENQEQLLEKAKADQKERSKLQDQVTYLSEENKQLKQEQTKTDDSLSEDPENLQSELDRYKDYLHTSEKRWAINYQALEGQLEEYKELKNKELAESKKQYTKTINNLSNDLSKLHSNNNHQKRSIKRLEAGDYQATENKDSSDATSKIKEDSPAISHDKDKNTEDSKVTVHINKMKNSQIHQAKDDENIPAFTLTASVSETKDNGRIPIEEIEGINTIYKKRLNTINIYYVDSLLNKGKTPSSRHSLAQRTDIDTDLVTAWVQNADLLRLNDMTPRYAKLLGFCDIHDIQSLAKEDKEQLKNKLNEVNKVKSFCPELPSNQEVETWINRAKKLEVKINYGHSDSAKVDKLTLIKGIGTANEAVLHSLGITRFEQIANFSSQDEVEIGQKLSSFHERITLEKWSEQAAKVLKNRSAKKA